MESVTVVVDGTSIFISTETESVGLAISSHNDESVYLSPSEARLVAAILIATAEAAEEKAR